MPEPQAPPVQEPSLLNQAAKAEPVEPTPESKLYPDPKGQVDLKGSNDPKLPKPDANGDQPDGTPDNDKKGANAPPGTNVPPEPKKEEPKEPSKPSAGSSKTPVDYENLKLPEGSLLSQEDLAHVKKEAQESGLSVEEAQGVLEVKNDAVKAFSARQGEVLAKARQEWKQSWLKDPEYGGDHAAQNTELAKRAWDRLADNELKTLADQTGFGDHPAVLRMMARVGKMFSEDTMVRGNVGAAPQQKAPEDILYGNSKSESAEPMA